VRLVDLSVPIEDSPSEPVRPLVSFEDHDGSAALVAGIFGCEVSDLPDGKGWRAVAETGRELEPYDIVLLWTGAEAAWGSPEYVNAGSGLGRDGTLWLLDRGVKVIGTDAWGLDRPLMELRARFERDRDPAPLWAAHRVGIEREYCQIEKLHNLGALPAATGFTVSCPPVKITGASAGWCRAVAMVDGA
jgi:kynurenine formamidase